MVPNHFLSEIKPEQSHITESVECWVSDKGPDREGGEEGAERLLSLSLLFLLFLILLLLLVACHDFILFFSSHCSKGLAEV